MDLGIYKDQMQKVIDYLESELRWIQVWVASTTMLDTVTVKASYGDVKINAIAHVSILDSKTIRVEPWDKKEAKHITAAIYDADIGLTPTTEADHVIVKVPDITKEGREDIAKKVKLMGEDVKARIRVIRQEGQKASKTLLTNKELSEDEHKNNEIDIDNMTKEKNTEIENLIKNKIEAVMKI